ncbi:hypothetical protein [Haloarcula argentinensis]|uniref:Uncharacterized protein n=1 Tax=Haloarcula argentinensis TaxID=43776 RepID=A0A830FJR0_HALAR|nr:hypothetical protein [Haloarcula argentinensis]MDS0252708.1 hypothetical protein [Haloarcula argentinensis]GGM30210.1 hypothetical protein GCM10009006_09630 [Haloarcula argentinensis]
MTRLVLSCGLDEARELVKEALWRTEGIKSIEEGRRQIVGKTDISFPRILWSYGENIYIDFSDPTDEGEIPIKVTAEKEIWMNATASPQKYKRQFLDELDAVRINPKTEVDKGSWNFSPPRSTGEAFIGTIGYPISMIVGGFLGLLYSALVFGHLFGIVVGSLSGVYLWSKRDTGQFQTTSMYLGLVFLGGVVGSVIYSQLNLGSTVGVSLMLILSAGFPAFAFYWRRQ